jgi:hypothetical protein
MVCLGSAIDMPKVVPKAVPQAEAASRRRFTEKWCREEQVEHPVRQGGILLRNLKRRCWKEEEEELKKTKEKPAKWLGVFLLLEFLRTT